MPTLRQIKSAPWAWLLGALARARGEIQSRREASDARSAQEVHRRWQAAAEKAAMDMAFGLARQRPATLARMMDAQNHFKHFRPSPPEPTFCTALAQMLATPVGRSTLSKAIPLVASPSGLLSACVAMSRAAHKHAGILSQDLPDPTEGHGMRGQIRSRSRATLDALPDFIAPIAQSWSRLALAWNADHPGEALRGIFHHVVWNMNFGLRSFDLYKARLDAADCPLARGAEPFHHEALARRMAEAPESFRQAAMSREGRGSLDPVAYLFIALVERRMLDMEIGREPSDAMANKPRRI